MCLGLVLCTGDFTCECLFLRGICPVLHAAKFHNISRNRCWFAALDISISNLIQSWVLQRGAEFHQRNKPNIVNMSCCFFHSDSIAKSVLQLDPSWNMQKTWCFPFPANEKHEPHYVQQRCFKLFQTQFFFCFQTSKQ